MAAPCSALGPVAEQVARPAPQGVAQAVDRAEFDAPRPARGQPIDRVQAHARLAGHAVGREVAAAQERAQGQGDHAAKARASRPLAL